MLAVFMQASSMRHNTGGTYSRGMTNLVRYAWALNAMNLHISHNINTSA